MGGARSRRRCTGEVHFPGWKWTWPLMRNAFSFAAVGFFMLCCLTAQAQPNESVESIRARYERQRNEVAQKLRTQKIELMQLLGRDEPDPDQCKKKLDQILSTERKRQYLFIDEMFAVKNGMSEESWRDYRRSVIMMMMNKNGSR